MGFWIKLLILVNTKNWSNPNYMSSFAASKSIKNAFPTTVKASQVMWLEFKM